MFRFLPQNSTRSRQACAYFFAICGVAYGSVMSRMPAIMADVGINEAELGSALLCLGLGALTAFAVAGWAQTRTTSSRVLIFGGFFQLMAFPLVGLADSLSSLAMAFYVMGLFNGTTEAAMGTQAVLVERTEGRPRMSSLHAMYSLGGLAGSLSGALLIGLAPFTHYCLIAALMLCLLPFASVRLLPDTPFPTQGKTGFHLPPLVVVIIGLLTLCSYASEGTVGDWGALFLHQIKGASEQTAALAFAAFSATMVLSRLFGDRLREAFGDYRLMRGLSIIALCGIMVALFSPWSWLCLAGYALMGVGQSAIVPILFSAVGRVSGISTGYAVAVVSAMGFGGLLIAPPLIGMLAHVVGLQDALSVIACLYLCLFFGSALMKRTG